MITAPCAKWLKKNFFQVHKIKKEKLMSETVTDLTVEELRTLIKTTVKEALEEITEDFAALASPGYLASIEEAREDYKEGRHKDLKDLPDV